MGREVRMGPGDWNHPKADAGNYIPLHGTSYSEALAAWEDDWNLWKNGKKRNFDSFTDFVTKEYNIVNHDHDRSRETFMQWCGQMPLRAEYMPDWKVEEKTHYQMYETCTEGTPISPPMETPEELARWLADNKASAFGSLTATYEEWLSTIQRGFSISALMVDGEFMSGVEAMHKRGV